MTEQTGLAAPCGIHCGMCPLYKALSDEKLRDTLAQRMNVPPEKATCEGCRAIAQLLANNVPLMSVSRRKAWTSAVTVQNSPAPNFCLALIGPRVYLTTSKSIA